MLCGGDLYKFYVACRVLLEQNLYKLKPEFD